MNSINTIPVIGLGGGSGCGKSTLVREIKRIAPFTITELTLDRYYRDLNHYSLEERATFNFDHPQALDGELFISQLNTLASGQSIEAPIYDFEIHTRIGVEPIYSADCIIAEGTLLFAIPGVWECMDQSVFLDAPDDIRLLRRIERDMHERGRTLDYITWQYLEMVRPMYLRYIKPDRDKADYILDGMKTVSALAEEFLQNISPLLRKQDHKPCSTGG